LRGKEETGIAESPKYLASRRKGEGLAKYLDVPLHDDTTGSPIVRDPEELDLSLRDMLLRYEARPERPDLTEGMRVRCRTRQEMGGEVAEMVLPPLASEKPKLAKGLLIAFLGALGSLLALNWHNFPHPTFDGLFTTAIPTLILLAITSALGKALCNGIATYTIRVDRSELCLAKTIFGLTRRKRIPVQELEELHLVTASKKLNKDSGKLVAIGDGFEISWGNYNHLADLKFVEQMINYTIASP